MHDEHIFVSSGTVKIVASKVLSVNQDIHYCVSAYCQSLLAVFSFENVFSCLIICSVILDCVLDIVTDML